MPTGKNHCTVQLASTASFMLLALPKVKTIARCSLPRLPQGIIQHQGGNFRLVINQPQRGDLHGHQAPNSAPAPASESAGTREVTSFWESSTTSGKWLLPGHQQAPGRWLPPCTPPVLPNVSTNEKSFYQKQLRNAWKKQLLKWSLEHLSETKTLQKLNTFSILVTSKVNIFVIIWILDMWKQTQPLYLSFRLRLFILAGEFLSYWVSKRNTHYCQACCFLLFLQVWSDVLSQYISKTDSIGDTINQVQTE